MCVHFQIKPRISMFGVQHEVLVPGGRAVARGVGGRRRHAQVNVSTPPRQRVHRNQVYTYSQ